MHSNKYNCDLVNFLSNWLSIVSIKSIQTDDFFGFSTKTWILGTIFISKTAEVIYMIQTKAGLFAQT